MTDNGEITRPYFMSFPIERMETTDDGDLLVYGKATDATLDHDQQVVDPAFSAKAIAEWMATGGNIREAHNPQRPVGVGVEAHTDETGASWVKGLVVDPTAKKLVAKGVLRAYSVGIANPTIERDITGKARGGIIKAGKIVELSLVDRPANPSCGFQLVKSASNGDAEYVGKVFGTEDAIQKALSMDTAPKTAGDVSDFNPADFEVSFSPNDMAELVMKKMAARYAEKRDFDRGVGGGVDRDKLPESDFAGPHRSFPIVSQGDVSDALHLVGHADNPDAVRARIRSIADRKGFSMPESASADSKKVRDELAIAKADIGGAGPLADEDCEPGDPTPGDNVPPKPEPKDEDSIKEATPDIIKDPEDKGNPKGKKIRDMDADGDYDDAPGKSAKAAMPPKKGKKMPKPKKGKGGKKLPPWLNKPGNDGDDANKAVNCGQQHEHTSKCHTTPKEAGNVAEAADMQPAPVGDLMESPAKPHMKGLTDSLTEAAMMRYKTIGMDTDMGILHDMTCPAFHPAEVAKVFPYADFASMIDEDLWQRKALNAATGKSISEAMTAQQVWQAAVTLKYANAAEVNDFRADLHKAFRDANPGVSSFPTPCAMSPTKYHRPNITDGHAAYGSGYSGPNSSAPVASGAPNAHSFSRPPLGSGHQTPSPSHMKTSFEYPDQQGVPTQIRYAEIEKEKARRALSTLHDHLNHMFPSSCPMLDKDPYIQEDGHNVALPVGIGKSAEAEEVLGDVFKYIAKLEKKVRAGELTEAQARDKLAKRTARKYAEDLRKQVDKGLTSIEEVRRALGIEPEHPAVQKSVAVDSAMCMAPVTAVEDHSGNADKGITPDVMKSMMSEILREQMAPLQEKIAAQESLITEYQQKMEAQQDELGKHAKRWEALADERDPSSAAFTGLAINPMNFQRQAPAGIAQQAEISKGVQGMMMRQLERTWRTSENPAEREAAYNALLKYQGKSE